MYKEDRTQNYEFATQAEHPTGLHHSRCRIIFHKL